MVAPAPAHVCGNCQAFHPLNEESTCGECRMNPPQVVALPMPGPDDPLEPVTCFPQVDPKDYCLKWERAR